MKFSIDMNWSVPRLFAPFKSRVTVDFNGTFLFFLVTYICYIFIIAYKAILYFTSVHTSKKNGKTK